MEQSTNLLVDKKTDSNSKRRLHIIVLIGFSIFGAVIVLEAGLRLVYFAGEKEFLGLRPMRSTIKYYEHPSFGHAFLPDLSAWFVPETQEYQTRVDTNSDGWPDVEHTKEKPDDTYRILILGDSFVENLQVPLDRRFYRQLETNLNAAKFSHQFDKEKVEVVALGRGNTGTAQQYLIIKDYGLSYNPDLIIHMFLTANDIKNNSAVLQGDPYLPYFELVENKLVEIPHNRRSDRRFSSIKEKLKNTRIVEILLHARQKYREQSDLTSADYPTDYHVYDTTFNSGYQSAWEVTKELIIETKKLSENNHATYKLIVLANNEQVHSHVWSELLETYPAMKTADLDQEQPDKLLDNFCVEHNVECHFMLPYFQKHISQNPQQTTHHRYDGHWNEVGTNLAAEYLTDLLINSKEND